MSLKPGTWYMIHATMKDDSWNMRHAKMKDDSWNMRHAKMKDDSWNMRHAKMKDDSWNMRHAKMNYDSWNMKNMKHEEWFNYPAKLGTGCSRCARVSNQLSNDPGDGIHHFHESSHHDEWKFSTWSSPEAWSL
jgi:hypothetical protein